MSLTCHSMPRSRIPSSNPTAIRFPILPIAATRTLLEAAVAPTLTLPPAQTQEALSRCQVGWNVGCCSVVRLDGWYHRVQEKLVHLEWRGLFFSGTWCCALEPKEHPWPSNKHMPPFVPQPQLLEYVLVFILKGFKTAASFGEGHHRYRIHSW